LGLEIETKKVAKLRAACRQFLGNGATQGKGFSRDTRGSSPVASRAPGVEDSAIVMRRAPGGVSPFNALKGLDETASASPRLNSGHSGTSPGERDPGSMSRNAEDARLSFDGVSPVKPLAGSGVTPREAAINLANCIMGAGALSLPSFFKSTGAVLGVALLLASCAWTWFSAVMMVKAADVVSIRVLNGVPVSSYEELMELTLGRNGKRLSAVGILLLQIGCLVGYANILADVVSPFAISVLPPGLEPNRGAVLAAVTLGAMLPIGVAVGGDGGSAGLAAVSKASIVIVGAFALILSTAGVLKTAQQMGSSEMSERDLSKPTTDALNMVRLEGMMSVLPLAIFAFGAHPAILPVTRAMRPAGLKPSVGVVTDVLRLCFVGYLMIGLGGYASFRLKTAGNVLRNTDGAFLGSFGSKALKSGYGLVILASVPTILLPLQKSARDAYLFLQPYVAPLPPGMSSTRNANPLVPGIDDLTTVPPEVANRLATVVAVTSMTCALYLSLYVPNVAFAFGLTGSTCSFLIAFVLPAASFLSATAAGARRSPGRGSARKRSLELEARGEAGKIMSGKKLAQTRDMSSDTNSFAKSSGASVAARGDSSLMRRSASQEGSGVGAFEENNWAWFGGEDPDSDDRDDDVLRFEPLGLDFDDGFGRADSLFDEKERKNATPSRGSNGAPISPRRKQSSHAKSNAFGTSSSSSKHASTRRWRFGAKLQITLAVCLSVVCTREVVRELVHENALVTVVSKMAEAKVSARVIEKESATVAAAKEKFVGASAELERASKDAERALDEVHHKREDIGVKKNQKAVGAEAVGAEDIDVITDTLEERLNEAVKGRAAARVEGASGVSGGDEKLADLSMSIQSETHSKRAIDEVSSSATEDSLPASKDASGTETKNGELESSLLASSLSGDAAVAETASVAAASLEKVKKVEAVASNTTLAKSALEDAIKHSDDEVRKVTNAGKERDSETGGKALDEGIVPERDVREDALDAEQIAADAEARREVSKTTRDEASDKPDAALDSATTSEKSREDLEETDGARQSATASDSTDLTAANASDVVAMADEKIHQLEDAKAKVETEAEKALETAAATEGVDETLAAELASALANLTGS